MQTKTFFSSNSSIRNYYKIYHYSSINSLSCIDPRFFGTGICKSQLKNGSLGINKSFYFISTEGRLPDPQDRPIRYEVYLPKHWKIYSCENDIENWYEFAINQLLEEGKVYGITRKSQLNPDSIAGRFEELLKKNGYKGRTHADGIALAIFEELSTAKPEGPCRIFDYQSEALLEEISNSAASLTELSSSGIF